jgi:diguanylate cyclase (GGDEF)-like protein
VTSILDTGTVLISYVISATICLAVVAPIWWNTRNRTPEAGFWLADYGLQAVGLLLIALRGQIPDLLSIVVANVCIIGGTVLLHIGLQRYLGRRTSQVHNWVMLAVVAAILVLYTTVHPAMYPRNMAISAGLLFICAQIAWLCLTGSDRLLRSATRGVGLVMVGYSALSLVRLVGDTMSAHLVSLFRMGLFDTAVILAYEMLFIGLTFGMLLMVNGRLVMELEGDIRVRELAESALRELSDHDPLTGLLNSRAFMMAATARLAHLGGEHASFVYLDLDYLKEANDRWGHAMGDRVLDAMADAMREGFRESDLIGRLGGDEFAVFAVSREKASDEALLARFAARMAAINASDALPVELAASYGVASWSAEFGKADLQNLIRVADERMYEMKRTHHGQGR